MPTTHAEQDTPFEASQLLSPRLELDPQEHKEGVSSEPLATSTSNDRATKTTITTTASSIHHTPSTTSSSSSSSFLSLSSTSSIMAKQASESHVQTHTSTTPSSAKPTSANHKVLSLLPFLRQLTPEWRAALLVCLRSYGIGYAFATAPKLIKTLITFLSNPRRAAKGQFVLWAFIRSLLQVGVDGFSAKRDGMSMLLMLSLGGHRVLDLTLARGMKKAIYQQQQQQRQQGAPSKLHNGGWQGVELDADLKQRITTMSSFISSAIAIIFMHRKRPRHATIDYTLFAVVRALDVFGHMAVKKKWGPSWLEKYGSVLVFQLACTEIMFAWLYEPERLPGPYAFWITRMSRMDGRLLQTLRGVRKGEILFGPGQAAAQPVAQGLLTGLCRDLKLPESWGSLDQNNLPCELVHQGIAKTCEGHGAYRWIQGFLVSSGIYLPVHLLPALLSPKAFLRRLTDDPVATSLTTLLATARSSAFLATYISLVWYGICTWRSRIMPFVMNVTGRRYPGHVIDYIYGPILGSALCGLSVLIEKRHRRAEMALYVLPRALFSLGSRVLQGKLSRRSERTAETLMFAVSMSVLLTAMQWDTSLVRPSMRGILGWILGQPSARRNKNDHKSQGVQVEDKKAESSTMQ